MLDAAERQEDLDSLVVLLAEVARDTPAPQQALVAQLYRTVRDGLDGVLTFVPHVAQVQHDLQPVADGRSGAAGLDVAAPPGAGLAQPRHPGRDS